MEVDAVDDVVGTMLAMLDEGFPAVQEMDAGEARAVVAARTQPVTNLDDVASADDHVVPGAGGGIRVRVYRPHGAQGRRLPVVVFAHGGGFVLCSIESHDGFCRMMARHLDAVVVSVDYRLAPEHRAPAAAHDVMAVVRHVVARSDDLGVDPGQVVVAGDSAGGNLVAVVALMARDGAGPGLAGQVLLYPVIDPDFTTDSYQRFGTGHFNTRAAMEWYWRNYLGNDHGELSDPPEHVAPLRALSHEGLPPAVVVTAGRDPLCSEGEAYAAALTAAGVPVRHRHYPELFHGFVTIGPFPPGASARAVLWGDILALLPDHTPLERTVHA